VDTIDQTNSTLVIDEIIQYASSMKVSAIVLGLPVHKNGTDAAQTNVTRLFANDLACSVLANCGPNVPVLYWDERYTSKEAAARSRTKHQNGNLCGTLDAEAACIILESFYKDNGKDAERVVISDEQYAASLVLYQDLRRREEQRIEGVFEKRRLMMKNMETQVQRAKKLEEEMRANGTLGESNKKKRKKRKKKK